MRSRLISGAVTLIFAILSFAPPATALRTSKTIIGSLLPFTPVPGEISPADTAAISKIIQNLNAKGGDLNYAGLAVKNIKAWPKATNDGFVACFQLSATSQEEKVAERYVAISISTGAFPGITGIQQIYDQEAYNIVGCSTPRATNIAP